MHTLLDQIQGRAEYAGIYDNVSPQASTVHDPFRNALRIPRKQTQNRSDGKNSGLRLSSNASKNHNQLSEDLVYGRDVQGGMTPLWDPNTDNPSTGKGLQRERHQVLASNSSRRLNPMRKHNQNPEKAQLPQRNRTPQALDSPPLDGPPEGPDVEPDRLLQPDTRPISHEQLVVEVKGIYAGLVMVEAKCVDIDEKQSAANASSKVNLTNDQWNSLIALHKQLLHEHHDFFLASQHPSASPALSRLAAKYSTPARMWRHGSGQFRMAIEDNEPKDREVWSNVARFWSNKAADKSPNIVHLYHHLAILARPYTLEQLALYWRSLTCVSPFVSARGSIQMLFNPTMVDDAKFNTPFEHKVLNATKLETDLLKPARELYRPLPEDYVVRGQLNTPNFSGGWFPHAMIDIDERWNELLSMAQWPIERMIRLGVRIKSVCLRSPTLEALLTDRLAALVSNSLGRRRLSLNSSLIVPLTASWLPAVKGSPIGNPGKASDSSIMTTSVHLLVGSLYVGFAAAALATAHSLATTKGPIRVWGSMMGILAYGWWAVKNDATASSILSIT